MGLPHVLCHAGVPEYYGIRLVERRKVLLSLKDRVEVIESADYSSSDDLAVSVAGIRMILVALGCATSFVLENEIDH